MRVLALLLLLAPLCSIADEVAPAPDLAGPAQRMEKKLKPFVGKSVRDIYGAFGKWQDSYPNGGVFCFLWETSKAKKACRFWFDVTRDERVVDWHWSGDC